MYFKKQLKRLSVALFTILLLVSCSKDDSSMSEPNQEEILKIELNDQEAALKKFEQALIKAQFAIQKKSNEVGPIQSEEAAQQLLTSVSRDSRIFLKEYGFTNNDYYEMFETNNIFEIQDHITAAGVFLYALERNKLISVDNPNAKGSSKIGDCFLEATGIAAGAQLLGSLVKGASKEVKKKALKKVLKKLGGKVIPAIGLIWMAADFIYCMSRDRTAILESIDLTCQDLLEARLLNSNKKILLSEIDPDITVTREEGVLLTQNKNYQTYDATYGDGTMNVSDITSETPCHVNKSITIRGSEIDRNSIREYTGPFMNLFPVGF